MTHITPPNTRIQYGFPFHIQARNITHREDMSHRSLKNVKMYNGSNLFLFFAGGVAFNIF